MLYDYISEELQQNTTVFVSGQPIGKGPMNFDELKTIAAADDSERMEFKADDW